MWIIVKKINLILLAALLLNFFINIKFIYSEENAITVYYKKETGQINKKVFGNNLIGYDPVYRTSKKQRGKYRDSVMDYGAGAWDPMGNKSVKEVLDLAKEAGMTIVRFPGGCGTHSYNWKDTIGDERRDFLYGTDEFLKTTKELGAEAVITVSYFTGNKQDAADLVEYLNAPDNRSNPNEGIDWAAERAKNGHPLPYKVRYFEIGNEVWHGNHRDIKKVLPEEYARRYLKYYGAMKAVDPSIKIGVVLHTANWNKRVLKIVKDKLDFGIMHIYPTPVWGKELERMKPENIFKVSLAIPVLKDRVDFPHTLRLLKENSGRDIPLAITEYNGGFVQDKPVPYRHSLGTALINAELLRIFMKPGQRVIMANYWQFSNSYWGMIKAEGDRFYFMRHNYQEPITYIKRPNYYVYELYNKHFGDVLIGADVKTGSYELSGYKPYLTMLIAKIKSGTIIKKNLLSGKWQIRKFPGVYVKEKNGILEIDFKDPKEFNYHHSIKRAEVEPDTYYRLSGYIRTEGLVDKKGVCLEILDGRGWAKNRPAVNTWKIAGTTEWQKVKIVYKTHSDAKSVIVRARRIGNKGPLKGKAFFKDLKLEKYIPALDTRIPYLSVNASKGRNGDRIYLMVINKDMNKSITSSISLKDFIPSGDADAWVLNGPGIDATNEHYPENVKVAHKKIEIKNNPFEFTFEPHSLTAIEIKGL